MILVQQGLPSQVGGFIKFLYSLSMKIQLAPFKLHLLSTREYNAICQVLKRLSWRAEHQCTLVGNKYKPTRCHSPKIQYEYEIYVGSWNHDFYQKWNKMNCNLNHNLVTLLKPMAIIQTVLFTCHFH